MGCNCSKPETVEAAAGKKPEKKMEVGKAKAGGAQKAPDDISVRLSTSFATVSS